MHLVNSIYSSIGTILNLTCVWSSIFNFFRVAAVVAVVAVAVVVAAVAAVVAAPVAPRSVLRQIHRSVLIIEMG